MLYIPGTERKEEQINALRTFCNQLLENHKMNHNANRCLHLQINYLFPCYTRWYIFRCTHCKFWSSQQKMGRLVSKLLFEVSLALFELPLALFELPLADHVLPFFLPLFSPFLGTRQSVDRSMDRTVPSFFCYLNFSLLNFFAHHESAI